MKKMIKNLAFLAAAFFLVLIFDCREVKAVDYNLVCNEIIPSSKGSIRRCGSNNIYLVDDENKSSYFTSTNEVFGEDQILYIGKIDGIDTFYARQFYYFGLSYDDRGFSTSKNDYWTDLSADDVLIYDGSFEDSLFFDQTYMAKMGLYDVVGTYLIRQYIRGKVTHVIKIIIPSTKDYSLDLINVKYGSISITSDNLAGMTSDIKATVTGGDYGYDEDVRVKVNECEFIVDFKKNITIYNEDFAGCLMYNEKNSLSITLFNGFNDKRIFKYSFKLNSNEVTIKMESTVSSIESSSRRIVIEAVAGSGKELASGYNLYYWSENPNDGLTYEDFMTNYENSQYKGTYTSNRGVILRNEEGIYYLYALAKDDDSTVVVRSDEYILTPSNELNRIMMKDVVFVVALSVCAAIPIFIYLAIRGKDN